MRVERAAVTEHGKENASEFVSGGGDGCRGTESDKKKTNRVTQRRAAAIQSGRGYAQGIGEPTAHVAGFGREDFAPADAVIRTKPQPGGRVPRGRKPGDLWADLAEEAERGLGAHDRNGRQIHSRIRCISEGTSKVG